MSPPQSRLPDRDPALDAAWKAHSTELPPRRLDAAILAAAHREARTRPHAIGDDDGVAHALGPSRAWWGLAAAATIGAIAFGVLQLAPPLETDPSATVATDVPLQERAPPIDAARDAPTRMAEAPRSPNADGPAAPREDDRRSALTRAPEPAPSATPRANAQKSAEQKQRRADAPERQREPAVESAVAAAGALADAPAAAASTPASPEIGVVTPRPFPGGEAAPSVAAAPASLSAPAPTPPAALAKSEAAGNAVDARRRESGERMAAAAPAQPAPQAAQSARRAHADALTQGTAAEPVAKLQARTPSAWIERIRTLHAGRRFDDAARELNAFREAYPDADARLPLELHLWAASVKQN